MAVSIPPRLNRIEPTSAMPKNDRINLQVNNNANDILKTTNAVSNLGQAGADIYTEFENEKIDQMANLYDQEFTIWNDQELNKLKNIEGDPTEAYVEYEKNAKQKFDDLIGSNPDVSGRVKNHVTSRLQKSFDRNKVAALKQRGAQQEIYDNKIFESGVALKKNSLATVAGYVRPNDEGSYFMFDENIHEIKTMIAKQGLKKGTVKLSEDDSFDHVYKDDDGKLVKVKMTDVARQRTAKELSEGVRNSIEVLIAGGQTDAAKSMQEKYKGYLDPKGSISINKKLKNEDTVNEADIFLSNLPARLSKDQRKVLSEINDPELRLAKSKEFELDIISGLPDGDLKNKVLSMKDSIDNRMLAQLQKKQEANYNLLDKQLNNLISQGQIFGLADLENDPVYKQTWDNLSSKQKQAIQETIKAPAVSNPNAVAKVNNLLLTGDISKVNEADFKINYLNGLSKEDKEKSLTVFKQFGQPSATAQRAVIKEASRNLKQEMINAKIIKYDGDSTRLKKKSQAIFNEAENALIEQISSKPNMTSGEMRDFVTKFVASKKKDEVFNPEKRDLSAFQLASPKGNVISNNPQPNADYVNGAKILNNGDVNIKDVSAQRFWINKWEQQYKRKFNPNSASQSKLLETFIKNNISRG